MHSRVSYYAQSRLISLGLEYPLGPNSTPGLTLSAWKRIHVIGASFSRKGHSQNREQPALKSVSIHCKAWLLQPKREKGMLTRKGRVCMPVLLMIMLVFHSK